MTGGAGVPVPVPWAAVALNPHTRYAALHDAADPLVLAGGGRLAPVVAAYETYGELAPDGGNAVFVCHALTGDAHPARHHPGDVPGWWERLIGPGRPIDTDRCFVVCANVLGGCAGSTGPGAADPSGRRYGPDFPAVSVADMVAVHRRLLDHLGVRRLRAVVGGSLGGMQALEWLLADPHGADSFLLVATTAAMSAENLAWNAVARAAIRADPEYRGGRYPAGAGPRGGLGVARMVGHLTYLNEQALRDRFGRAPARGGGFSVEAYLHHQARKLVERFDAGSYLCLIDAMDRFDAFAGGRRPVLTGPPPRVDVFSFHGDRLFGEEHSRALCRALAEVGVPARHHHEPDAVGGHDAFLLDTPGFLAEVAAVLAELPHRPLTTPA